MNLEHLITPEAGEQGHTEDTRGARSSDWGLKGLKNIKGKRCV